MNLNSSQYQDINRIISKYVNTNILLFGTVTAADNENRLVKVNIQPYDVETGWIKVLQGAFSDKIGIEVLVGTIKGTVNEQYIVLGIIE